MNMRWRPGVNLLNCAKLHELPQDERNELRAIINSQSLTKTLAAMQLATITVDSIISKMIYK